MDENAESDRLSELPDSLLLGILSLLEMKDVVRTTILSKRWKDLWTVVPCLDFYGENNQSFIDGALAKWKGAKILRFTLNFYLEGPPPSDLLDSWLLLSIQKQVEDLVLDLSYDIYEYDYRAPQTLNSCSSITRLVLFDCNLKIEENVQWNRLKSLEIYRSSYLSEDAVNWIISGAPLLEDLKLFSWNMSENLSIRSTSLKMLEIEIELFKLGVAGFATIDSVLSVWAPNLESVAIDGEWHTRCLLNVPSLINATLGLDSRQYRYAPLSYTAMRQAFRGLSNVQKLTLKHCAIKFLFDEIKRGTYLSFPKLVMLIVEQYQDNNLTRFARRNSKTIFPTLSLLQLMTVVITCDVLSELIGIIEILLENATALEKMEIRLRKHHSYTAEQHILDLGKVVGMRRASPRGRVTIIVR